MPTTPSTRRDFLKTSTAVGTTAALAASFAAQPRAFAAGDETLKVGLVGCGGRGSGAARQALLADPQTKLVAMGDAFEDNLQRSLNNLKSNADVGAQVHVDEDHQFVGLDAYQHVIDAVDVVLLATPPGFRPQHLKAAVDAGKHIFTEKPMAVDFGGAKMAMDAVRKAEGNGKAMVAGFCWRYDNPRRELFQRIADGQIGDVRCLYGTYLTGPVKPMPEADTRPEGLTDLEWMVRNWYNFDFISGDGLVEQACHTVDWLMWAMGDVPPVSCTAVGGRQIPAHGGNIFDHIEVNYLWENGVRGFLAQRQIPGCHNENYLNVLGTEGEGDIRGRVSISGVRPWRYKGDSNDMYQTEHNEMFSSIRAGEPINNGDRMMTSTIAAIMGREAAYTGKQLTWEQAMASEQVLMPPDLHDWNATVDVRPMARPGVTSFV
ncbi:MAG: Gfo/Idh/MocA family oxidoreductase [Planctomycetaceae bacterium]|nr:Gfo/Idh/MocA family oxidoreductase [Planctomycetaceae bacterium]